MSTEPLHPCPADHKSVTWPSHARISRRQLLRTTLGAVMTVGAHAAARPRTALAFTPATAAPATESVVLRWNRVALQGVRDTRMGPPLVARALAVVHTCIYDAWAAYNRRALGTRLGDSLRQPREERTLEHKTEAISYAAYRALVDLFPAQQAQFTTVMENLGYDPADMSTAPRTPRGIGNLAAQAMLADAHRDGTNQFGDLSPGAYADYTGYAPVNTPDEVIDPNHWQPLRVEVSPGTVVVQRFLAPHWGLVRPFALTSGDQFRPRHGPPLAPAPAYREQAQQILEISAQLNDQQKMIAEYWADGPATETPPGHWNVLAAFVAARDGHDLDADVMLFFALTNALFDASIAAWDAKRAFDFVRPITAIRTLWAGEQVAAWGGPYQGTQHIDGAHWQPYQAATFVTPPFPEFVSGHSTFSAAAAEVLRRFTGDDTFGMTVTLPIGSSRIEAGAIPAEPVTLTWPTFSAAADEAGLSRRYGGIHFEAGDLAGREIGRRVGTQAWHRARAYIQGCG